MLINLEGNGAPMWQGRYAEPESPIYSLDSTSALVLLESAHERMEQAGDSSTALLLLSLCHLELMGEA